MLCDFFAHPAVPVPAEHFDAFAEQTMSFAAHPAALETRAIPSGEIRSRLVGALEEGQQRRVGIVRGADRVVAHVLAAVSGEATGEELAEGDDAAGRLEVLVGDGAG